MTHLHDQILPTGTQLGVYEIKGVLKVGAFDITYHAWNHHLKERVDIQEFFPHELAVRTNGGLGTEPKSPNDKENFEYGLKTFVDYAELLTQIEHPNIVAVENVLQLNGTAYLVRAHPEGASLSKVAQPPASLGETELRFILTSILSALQRVHEAKLIHGGIQPATIRLGKNGEPLLTDFAAARLAMAARMLQLDTELAMGYAPAEQYEQRYEPGPASDFYALGATLYYCMTHHQPVAPHDRIIAISKGEPDPMILPAESAGAAYSAEWLKAIDWMLQPNYSNRPQSTDEILSLLKSSSQPEEGKSTPPSSQQKTTSDEKKSVPVTGFSVGVGVMFGIIALISVGLWFGEKTAESLEDQQERVATQSALEQDTSISDQPLVTPATPEDTSIAMANTESSQPTAELMVDNAPSPASSQANQPAAEEDTVMATDQESSKEQPVITSETSLPQHQTAPDKAIDEGLIESHLAAAEKAMRAVRFTTPQRDNAFKYYQMVLEIDPDNTEAHAGLQRIVDRYIQFIAKARLDGRQDEAKLYLQRAESVLPDDARLLKIRTELMGADE